MGFTRNRGSKLMRFRHGNGRFGRATMESAFGLKVPICAHCRTFNPHDVGTPRPEKCHACGEPLIDISEAAHSDGKAAE